MLDRLLESKPKRARSAGGTILSVTAHTALIAAAVYATAQARVAPKPAPVAIRPVYFPLVKDPAPLGAQRTTTTATLPTIHEVPTTLSVPDVSPPSINLSDMLSHSDDFHAATTAGATSAAGLASPTDSAGTVLSAEQVERQASLAPGNVAPRYPESLRNAGVEGRVMATFVVDVSGRAEDTTVRFARSDNGLFEDAVRGALRRMRFIPAEVGGRKVRQLVQMPFVFTLSR